MRRWPSSWPCSSSAAAVWEALWGSTPIITGIGGAFLEGRQGHRGGQADFGHQQSSVEPLPVGCRQDRTTVLEPTRPRVAAGVVERPASTLEPYGCSPGAPTAFNNSISRWRVVEVAAALGLPLPTLAALAVAALAGALDLGGWPTPGGARLPRLP